MDYGAKGGTRSRAYTVNFRTSLYNCSPLRSVFLRLRQRHSSQCLRINSLPDNGSSYTIPRTETLRKLLNRDGILLGPAAYDGISAKLTESAGFDFAFMSGFSVAGARLGLPDTGLVSYGEMIDQGRQMIEATSSMPLIGDGDTGHGNAMNVIRTVQGYAHAGFSGILIEDQVWPKSCGHVKGKQVIPRDEAIARIRAACDARKGGQDIVIVARTDAKQAIGFREALERAQSFADAGADVVFIDALETVAEMRTFCAEVTGAHKMANMLEGGGKTPILQPSELEQMGFKLVAYPLSLLGVSIQAMQGALNELKRGDIPKNVPQFSDLQHVVGFTEYFATESKYAVSRNEGAFIDDEMKNRSQTIDPDIIIDPSEKYIPTDASPESMDVTAYDTETTRDYSTRRSKWLRFKIIDSKTGNVNLDTRFPAGFLDGIAAMIPQISGIDLRKVIEGNNADKNEPAFSFEADGDTIQIFVEERKSSGKLLLEVCVDSVDAAKHAMRAGADRIEICERLDKGGLSPDLNLVKAIGVHMGSLGLEKTVRLYAMIRRDDGGKFLYNSDDKRQMMNELNEYSRCGILDGVVFGMLARNNDTMTDITIDMEGTKLMALAAHKVGLDVTFHRAFDKVTHKMSALEFLANDCRVSRVLTSGHADRAIDSLCVLADLVQFCKDKLNGRISIMPGSGVSPENIETIVRKTGAMEIHGSFQGCYNTIRVAKEILQNIEDDLILHSK